MPDAHRGRSPAPLLTVWARSPEPVARGGRNRQLRNHLGPPLGSAVIRNGRREGAISPNPRMGFSHSPGIYVNELDELSAEMDSAGKWPGRRLATIPPKWQPNHPADDGFDSRRAPSPDSISSSRIGM